MELEISCEVTSSRRGMASALVNSQQLGMPMQDLHKTDQSALQHQWVEAHRSCTQLKRYGLFLATGRSGVHFL